MVHRTIPSRIKRSIRSYLLLPSLHSARGTGRVTDSAYLFFAAQVHEITTGNHDACFGIYGKGSECITHPSAPHRLSNGHCELSRNFHCKKKAEGKTRHIRIYNKFLTKWLTGSRQDCNPHGSRQDCNPHGNNEQTAMTQLSLAGFH